MSSNASILEQIKTFSKSPLAAGVGAIAGGSAAFASATIAHNLGTPYRWEAIIVAGGLLFSSTTVFDWGRAIFKRWDKALGFVVLMELTMLQRVVPWLGTAAMVLLIAINAVANGHTVATQKSATKCTSPKEKKSTKRVGTSENSGVRKMPTRALPNRAA